MDPASSPEYPSRTAITLEQPALVETHRTDVKSPVMLWKSQRYSYFESIKILCAWTALLLVVEAADQIYFGNELYLLGIRRGDFEHWYRIFFAPFLHDDFAHVLSNLAGLLILGSIVLSIGAKALITVTGSAVVVSGSGVLFFGAEGIHAGASSVVYGYFGFLVIRGISERSWKALLIGALVLFVFHGLLTGLLPGRPGTSWHGHLFGFLGGAITAAGMASMRRRSPRALSGSSRALSP